MAKLVTSDGDTGILLCDCHGEMRNLLDFTWLEKELKKVGGVAECRVCSELCNLKECCNAVDSFLESGMVRVVVGGCNKSNYEEQISKAFDSKQYIWWSVNIYEQCALVHRNKQDASEKVLRRLSASVARVKLAQPVKIVKKTVRQDVAVIGGGVAGLQAAVSLERLGHKVMLVDKRGDLGGRVASIPEFLGHVVNNEASNGNHVGRHIDNLVNRVKESRRIHIYPGMFLKAAKGEPGDFLVTISSKNGKDQHLRAGAIVLATGSNRISVFQSGDFEKTTRIIGLSDFFEIIRKGSIPGRIAIIMDLTCEQDRNISSLVLSSALYLVNRFCTQVKVFCNNIRVAATGLESLYRRSRNAGIVIVKSEEKPVIKPDSAKVTVIFHDEITSLTLSEDFDLAVVADFQTLQDNQQILNTVEMLKLGPDNVLQYDDVWLLPTQTNRPGIFVIGGARGNSEYREALTDGMAVASEVHTLLREKQITLYEDAAIVDSNACVLCLTCMRICPHGAVRIDNEKKAASISIVSCQRCGICVSECPAKAITLPNYSDEQITADIGEKPRVTVLACENSTIPAADAAGIHGYEYNADVEIITIPCAGRVDPVMILNALERGAERVLVLGCHPESCKYLTGSSRSKRRINRLTAMLDNVGFDATRVMFGGMAALEPARFVEYITAQERHTISE